MKFKRKGDDRQTNQYSSVLETDIHVLMKSCSLFNSVLRMHLHFPFLMSTNAFNCDDVIKVQYTAKAYMFADCLYSSYIRLQF